MADIINARRQAKSLDIADAFDNYTKVVINISDEESVSAGTDTGRTLTIDNPLGTQQLAQSILEKLRGFRYQPYVADDVLLDPAAELGDGLSVNNIYGGIYQRDLSFSRLMSADVSAPFDAEVNHEYKYTPSEERMFRREIGDVRASLMLQANKIEAKVDNTSASEFFGWELMSDHWSVTANGGEVFRVDASGGTFTGQVVASSGKIGGFTITASSIYSNLPEFGGSQTSGVYIGVNGIQLGQNFAVDASGNMMCRNATVTGTIRAGDIQFGNTYGYLSGEGITAGSIQPLRLNSYCLGGIGGGINYSNATKQSGGSYPPYFRANVLNAADSMRIGGYRTLWREVTVGGATFYVLARGAYAP